MNYQVLRRRALLGLGLFAGGITIGRLGRLDKQVGQFRRRWEEHNLATVRQLRDDPNGEPFVLVALGDSSTQGIGADSIEQGYVPQLAALIEQHLGRPVAVVNLSISGGTIETVLVNQVPLLAGLGLEDADLVVFNIGGNDVGVKEMSTLHFRDSLLAVSEQLPERTIVGNIPSFSMLPQDARAEELSAIIDQFSGRPVVDLRGFTESYSATEYLLRYHAADLFHPNSRAYTEWARLFFEAWLDGTSAIGGPVATWKLSER